MSGRNQLQARCTCEQQQLERTEAVCWPPASQTAWPRFGRDLLPPLFGNQFENRCGCQRARCPPFPRTSRCPRRLECRGFGPPGTRIGNGLNFAIEDVISVVGDKWLSVSTIERRLAGPVRGVAVHKPEAANGITSTGSLPREPSCGTSFSSPTRMMSCRDAAATTFSRTSARP